MNLVEGFKKQFEKKDVRPMAFDSQEERIRVIEESRRVYTPDIKLQFVQAHQGFKDGFTHLILSSTGSGKSTLTRTVLFEALKNYRVFWYSTEETYEEFREYCASSEIPNKLLKNLFFKRECESESIVDVAQRVSVENSCDLFIFDNYTTCKEVISLKQDEQIKLFKKIRDVMLGLKIPLIVVAHTSSESKNFKIEKRDPFEVRGFKDISMESHVIYSLETFKIEVRKKLNIGFDQDDNEEKFYYESEKISLLNIIKSRKKGEGKNYMLVYDHNSGFYKGITEVDDREYFYLKKKGYMYSKGKFEQDEKEERD